MEIKKQQDNKSLTISLTGRLDTTTAPNLEAELKNLNGISSLTIDMSNLEYISSAGLRVLLSLNKTMAKQGSLTVKNVNETVKEVFDITGFTEILTIV